MYHCTNAILYDTGDFCSRASFYLLTLLGFRGAHSPAGSTCLPRPHGRPSIRQLSLSVGTLAGCGSWRYVPAPSGCGGRAGGCGGRAGGGGRAAGCGGRAEDSSRSTARIPPVLQNARVDPCAETETFDFEETREAPEHRSRPWSARRGKNSWTIASHLALGKAVVPQSVVPYREESGGQPVDRDSSQDHENT